MRSLFLPKRQSLSHGLIRVQRRDSRIKDMHRSPASILLSHSSFGWVSACRISPAHFAVGGVSFLVSLVHAGDCV